MIIPRTAFEGELWRCGHPKTEENTAHYGRCRFCERMRRKNHYHERIKPRRPAPLTVGQKIVLGII